MPIVHAGDRERRRRALSRCPACGGPSLPECLLCESEAIVRSDGLTQCADCGDHTFCPCEAGITLPDSEDPDDGVIA